MQLVDTGCIAGLCHHTGNLPGLLTQHCARMGFAQFLRDKLVLRSDIIVE